LLLKQGLLFSACILHKCGSTHWLLSIYQQHLSRHKVEKISRPQARQSFPEQGLNFAFVAPSARLAPAETVAKSEKALDRVLHDDTYFKFAIVRHPWARLISGYRDKYLTNCSANRTCMSQQYKVPLDLTKTEPASLDEFLEALLTVPLPRLNYHFRPSSVACEVGRVPYDYIADLSLSRFIPSLNSSGPLSCCFCHCDVF
jgi:hypothetical protein